MTDSDAHFLDPILSNLMFVRFRTNCWNLDLLDRVVSHYTEREVPVILTFMAYYEGKIPEKFKKCYSFRKRTINDYWAITHAAWQKIMDRYQDNVWVYSCGREEFQGATSCKRWGKLFARIFCHDREVKENIKLFSFRFSFLSL